MSTRANPLQSQNAWDSRPLPSPATPPVAPPPSPNGGGAKSGFFANIGKFLKENSGAIADIGNQLAAAGGNYAPMQIAHQAKMDALHAQLQQSEMSNQALNRQLLQFKVNNQRTPEQEAAAQLQQAGALEDVRNLHAPGKDTNTPEGVVENVYDPSVNPKARINRPKMMTSQVPNPAIPAQEATRQAFAGLQSPDNPIPPPVLPAVPSTVPLQSRVQLAAPPKLDTSITPYEDARRGVPQTAADLSKFASDWQKQSASNKNVNTGEDLKNRIAVAYEKGDTATVAKLQAELKAIDPFGAERLADANQRLQDAQAKTAEAQRQFHPAIAGSVLQAASTQDSVRRLMGILKPYNTDNQPFGNFLKQFEYKYGKAQSDTLGQELAGINLSGLQQAASVLKQMGGVRAVQALNLALAHTPDPTKDSTALMYQKMQNIDRALATYLKDADKYGRKASTDIEPERMTPYGETPPTMPGVPGAHPDWFQPKQ